MSLFGAMQSAVTGLDAQSQALGAIADNISNSRSVGYKTTDTRFSSLVTEITPLRYQPGGVRSRPFHAVGTQGLLEGTSSETDLAISGAGFFAVQTAPTAGSELLFTRAGDFFIDPNGDMRNTSGFFLQAWAYDPTGTTVNGTNLSQTTTVNTAGLTSAATATSNIDLSLNLDANTIVGGTFNVDIPLIDGLGAAHNVRMTYTKVAANQWVVSAADAGTTIGGAITVAPAAGGGPPAYNLAFDSTNGSFDTADAQTPATGAYTLSVTLPYASSGATAPATFTVDMLPSAGSGTTQFAGFNDIRFISGDGVATGSLSGVNVEQDGDVVALFDNGAQRNIYRIPITTFQNPNGVDYRDGTVYAQTGDSGVPTPKVAGTGGAGTVVAAALEGSTTDIGTEFSRLIVTQRAYSANTRTISTANEMVDDLLRIIT